MSGGLGMDWEQHSKDHWPPPVGAQVYPVLADGTVEMSVGEVRSHNDMPAAPVPVVVWWPDIDDHRSHSPGHLVTVADYQRLEADYTMGGPASDRGHVVRYLEREAIEHQRRDDLQRARALWEAARHIREGRHLDGAPPAQGPPLQEGEWSLSATCREDGPVYRLEVLTADSQAGPPQVDLVLTTEGAPDMARVAAVLKALLER